jgi:FkbH-like protein
VTLYVRLKDKWGDYGIISAFIAEIKGNELHIDTWLMSCRVFQRGVEYALFDLLLRRAQMRGIECIWGYYSPTVKNSLVADFYGQIGFVLSNKDEAGNKIWIYRMSDRAQLQPYYINVKELFL